MGYKYNQFYLSLFGLTNNNDIGIKNDNFRQHKAHVHDISRK